MFGLSTTNHWTFAFGVLGNLASFMVYLAPVPTFWRVYRRRSTEGFQSVPYVVALFSATLWIYYALLKTDAEFLITINAAGCVIELAYIIVYLVYAPKEAKLHTAKLVLLLNVAMFGLIVLVSLVFVKGSGHRVTILGWVCAGFSLCVFIAPLSIIRLVMKTKSVEYMPFSLSLFLTLSAVAWFFYGFLLHDKYIAIPNVLGFFFGLIQMVLYAVYMNNGSPRCVDDQEHGLPEHKCVAYIFDNTSDLEKSNLCILVAGALGGRFDHEVGNLNILYKFSNIRIILISEDCLIHLLPKTHHHEIYIQPSVEGPHCGLIPLGTPSSRTTTTGLQWDLTDTSMGLGGLISTSNIAQKEKLTVQSDSDLLWTISIKKMA